MPIDLAAVKSIWTVWMIALFVGIVVWTLWPSRRREMQDHARIPFREHDDA